MQRAAAAGASSRLVLQLPHHARVFPATSGACRRMLATSASTPSSSSSSSSSNASTTTTTPEKHHFWLRAEAKKNERRSILLPEHVERLLQAGHRVTVERSRLRCAPDAEYQRLLKEPLAEEGSWKNAPRDAIVLGLKELPEDDDPIKHQHVYFAHVFKGQKGAEKVLKRYAKGGGKLWDLEFLVDDKGARVAAFSGAAGKVGMGLAFAVWAHQKLTGRPYSLPPLNTPYDSFAHMAHQMRELLDQAKAKVGHDPSVIVVGSRGRSGKGAVSFSESVGIKPTEWGREQTAKGGPFPELLNYDILINAIYLLPEVRLPAFITKGMIDHTPDRKLSVFSDVSCDVTNPHSVFPIYDHLTSFVHPTECVAEQPTPLEVIAIDHLPSLVPRESSKEFGDLIVEHILQFDQTPVWSRALKLFDEKVQPFQPPRAA